ncbi:hypothetical protein EJB05_57611, partial [Eragrostis curvula]
MAAAATATVARPHALLIPYPCSGHINPTLHFAFAYPFPFVIDAATINVKAHSEHELVVLTVLPMTMASTEGD